MSLKKKLEALYARYRNVGRLCSYLGPHRRLFIFSIFCGIFHNIFTLGSLLLGSYLTALAFTGAPADRIRSLLLPLFLAVAGKGLFQYLHMLLCHDVAYCVIEDLRGDLYDAVEKGAPRLTLKYRTGDISSIVMEDVESLEAFLAHIIGDYVIAFVCMLLFLALFFVISPPAALLSLIVSIPLALIPYMFGRLNQKRGKALRERLGQTNAGVVDTIQGLKEIIFFGREEQRLQQIKDDTMALNRLEVADGMVKGLQAGLSNLLLSGVLVAVLVLGHSMVIRGTLDPMLISILVTMTLNVFLPIAGVSGTANRMNLVAAAADRVVGLLHEPPAIDEQISLPEEARTLQAEGPVPLIAVRDLHFSYTPDKPVLKGLNLDIRKGESVALTGESGVGKSTLINLILRFYDPVTGHVYLDGKNLKTMPPEEVRRHISFVPQDVYLFRGTIMDNLKLAAPEASDEEVRAAARIALADGFIRQLKGGYGAFVGERGLTLSGGQKQRIAIARALLTGAPILIMDEAVSNLDSESEELFREALRNVAQERTVITIAHRRSTLLEAERLIILRDGRAAWDGPPSEAPLGADVSP